MGVYAGYGEEDCRVAGRDCEIIVGMYLNGLLPVVVSTLDCLYHLSLGKREHFRLPATKVVVHASKLSTHARKRVPSTHVTTQTRNFEHLERGVGDDRWSHHHKRGADGGECTGGEGGHVSRTFQKFCRLFSWLEPTGVDDCAVSKLGDLYQEVKCMVAVNEGEEEAWSLLFQDAPFLVS